MNYAWQSLLLVTIQMTGIGAIFATGPLVARQPLYLLLQGLGLAVGLWALLTMRQKTFSVLPDVKVGASLVHRGPYRWLRHPMYLAVLLVTGALVCASFTWVRLLIWLVLIMDILIKINYEERLLSAHYPAYAAYRRQTKRLLPYLY
jgi:protein-S-isoprenylcysteine O-methyltransferase Ste14